MTDFLTEFVGDIVTISEIIRQVEEEKNIKFVVYSQESKFSDKEWKPEVGKIFWEKSTGQTIPFDGVPFMFIGQKVMGCHLGRDKAKKQKIQYALARKESELQDRVCRKHRQNTKKTGCPAKLTISRIAKFPAFKVCENKERAKKERSAALRVALQSEPIIWEDVFYLRMPGPEDHVGHPVDNALQNCKEENPEDAHFHIVQVEPGMATSGGVRKEHALDMALSKRRRKTMLKRKCIAQLKAMVGAVYRLDDGQYLEALDVSLQNLRSDIERHAPAEGELPMLVNRSDQDNRTEQRTDRLTYTSRESRGDNGAHECCS